MSKLTRYVKENKKKPCIIEGCDQNRSWHTKYCRQHSYNCTRWGSPHGCVLKPEIDYPRELKIASNLIHMNAKNESILIGVQWIEDMIRSAHAGSLRFQNEDLWKLLAGDIFYRLDLGSYNIQWEVLPKMVALYLVEMGFYSPPSVPNLNLPWRDATIGHTLLRSGRKKFKRKYPVKHSSVWRCYKEAGKMVVDNIGVLLSTLASACMQLQKKLDQREKQFLNAGLLTDPDEIKAPDPQEPETQIVI
jgi:hypothetical protein